MLPVVKSIAVDCCIYRLSYGYVGKQHRPVSLAGYGGIAVMN